MCRCLDSDFPPAKRRRTTLADNLLTSALNVALVSTALGITAYRMYVYFCSDPPDQALTRRWTLRWTGRDEREREPEMADKPPPYEEGDWAQVRIAGHRIHTHVD